jgi:two-component system response regulator TctD
VVLYGDLSLDAAARTASVQGAPLPLTRREFRLLEILLANRGRVIPKDRLFDKLFSFEETDVGLNAVELYIGRLRRKLAASKVSIRTLRGLGYQLERHE